MLDGGRGGFGGEDGDGPCDEPRTGGSGLFDVFARGGSDAGAFELSEEGALGFREEGGGGDCDWDPMGDMLPRKFESPRPSGNQGPNFAE